MSLLKHLSKKIARKILKNKLKNQTRSVEFHNMESAKHIGILFDTNQQENNSKPQQIKDFEKLARLNPKTFCKTISYDYIQQQNYQELNISTKKLVEELSYTNLRCDDNFNLK